MTADRLDQLAINTIRTLTLDAVEAAKSGHPGAPMAMAPVGYTLWSRFLRYDPADPAWPNRDRFVLSAGHASMLLYSLIHLAGVQAADKHGVARNGPAVSLDDIKTFRQLGSVCAGHPELHAGLPYLPGLSVTLCPLSFYPLPLRRTGLASRSATETLHDERESACAIVRLT